MSLETRLNAYVHEHIPLTRAMGATVYRASSDEVIVKAPLANNVNHQLTVFGGSLHAVATLSCWCLLYTHLIEHLGTLDIVIAHSEIDYLKPVTSDFAAVCVKPKGDMWDKFLQTLTRKGKSRIELEATISEQGALAVRYRGEFAVIKHE
jgi:thioesterase domain-containing protein